MRGGGRREARGGGSSRRGRLGGGGGLISASVSRYYKLFLRDKVGLTSRGCRKVKSGGKLWYKLKEKTKAFFHGSRSDPRIGPGSYKKTGGSSRVGSGGFRV